MAVLYAFNNNLGIFNYEDSEDDLRHFEDHPDLNECPDPVFTNEVDPPPIPPDGAMEVTAYTAANLPAASCIPPPIPEANYYMGEYNSGEEVVEASGYIPLTRRIQDLISAGESLRAYRESVYDGHDIGDDSIVVDPYNRQNMDLTDFDELAKKAAKTMATVQEAMNAKEQTPVDVPPANEASQAVQSEATSAAVSQEGA